MGVDLGGMKTNRGHGNGDGGNGRAGGQSRISGLSKAAVACTGEPASPSAALVTAAAAPWRADKPAAAKVARTEEPASPSAAKATAAATPSAVSATTASPSAAAAARTGEPASPSAALVTAAAAPSRAGKSVAAKALHGVGASMGANFGGRVATCNHGCGSGDETAAAAHVTPAATMIAVRSTCNVVTGAATDARRALLCLASAK